MPGDADRILTMIAGAVKTEPAVRIDNKIRASAWRDDEIAGEAISLKRTSRQMRFGR
jgi:hypothetical protein